MSEPKTMKDVRNSPDHIRAVAGGVKILDDTEGCPIAKEAWAVMMDNADEIERLKAMNERDRTTVADGVTAIFEAIRAHEWLRLGRGSYEWDDDRWRDEFSAAIDKIMEAMKPLQRVASDWDGCPMDRPTILAARAGASDKRTQENTGE